MRAPLSWLLFAVACAGGSEDTDTDVIEVRVDHPQTSSASNALQPRLCTVGSTLHVAWQDLREGHSAVWYNRSSDGGLTWFDVDVRVDDGAGVASDPHLACASERVYMTWRDTSRDAVGREGVRLIASTDGGSTFSHRLWLDAQGEEAYSAIKPQVAAAGATVAVAWTDARNGAYDVFVNVSTDSGATWFVEPVRVDGGEAGGAWSADPKVAVSQSGRVVVLWQDGRDTLSDIYTATSSDYGQSFGDALRLDEGLAGGGESFAASLVLEDEAVAVAWHEGDTATGWRVAVAQSSDGGESWYDAVGISEEGSDAFEPTLVWGGGGLHVAWHERRAEAYAIYATVGSGSNWSEPQRLNTDEGAVFDAYDVRLLADGEDIVAAWQDRRFDTSDIGMNDLYLSRSIDSGETWLLEELRLNGGEAGTSYAVACQIAREGDALFAVWEDGRFGFSGLLATTRDLATMASQ